MESTGINHKLVDNSINLYNDSRTLLQKLPKFIEFVENKLHNNKSKDIIRQSLQPTEELLQGTQTKICECVVNELFEYFNTQLKQVSDIPRLYRKTNRSVPTKPCNYIEVIVKSMRDFNEDASNRVENAFLVELYSSLFNVLTEL